VREGIKLDIGYGNFIQPERNEGMEDLGIIRNGALAIGGKEIVAVGETAP